nr:luciferin 4-monooxygenase-like [Onthophagus taurus]
MTVDENFVVHGKPNAVAPIECSNGQFFHKYLLEHINKGDFFVNENTEESITYKDFTQKVCRMANCLKKIGARKDRLVAIISENNVNYFIPMMGSIYVGSPVVPMNPLYTETELSHALGLIEPFVVFCSVYFLDKVLALKEKFPCIEQIVLINSPEPEEGCPTLDEFLDTHCPGTVDVFNFKPDDVDIDNQVAIILFSSGTTGLPKGVQLTHRNWNTKATHAFDPAINAEIPTTVALGLLPFFHGFGVITVFIAIIKGLKVVIMERFDPETYLHYIEKYKIASLNVAPPLLHFFAKHPLVDNYDMSHVQEMLVGAGAVSQSIEREVKKRIPVKHIRQGYGLTETTVVLTLTPSFTEKTGSCGVLDPDMLAVVRDPETGKNLGPNQEGELCFKGPLIMKGYYKNDAANKETFTSDGYMRTGDIGYYDENEYFYIVDRLKELIKYKGYQVAPAELEGVLLSFPKIKDVAVVGFPDEEAGELPMAFVVKQDDVDVNEAEIVNFVKSK